MSNNETMYNLLQGLKQLDMNLKLLQATHHARGIDPHDPYTVNTANILKLEYVDKSLEILKANSGAAEQGKQS